MRTDHLGAEVERLGPESRALIELSVIRGLADEELAEMLGMEVDRLRARRERVMRDLGADSAEEREALALSLRKAVREPQPEDAEGASPGADPRHLGERAPPVAGEPRPRRRAVIALGGGVSIALAVALVFALTRDDPPVVSDEPAPGGPGEPAPGGPDAPRTGRFEAVGGGRGDGTARITGPEDRRILHVSVRGLPRPFEGGYVIWLYDSISEARGLAGSRRGNFTVREPLPPDFARYRFLDVSREPADGNLSHNGRSVLRVPLEQIPGA